MTINEQVEYLLTAWQNGCSPDDYWRDIAELRGAMDWNSGASAGLAGRLRSLYAAKTHHFTPGSGEQAFAIVATEQRLRDLLSAAELIEAGRVERAEVSEAD